MSGLSIEDAAARIRAGELVAFPTETVYGLGANALDAVAVAKIYQAKERPRTSPLIVHVSSIEMARTLVTEWPREAETLARTYWPGPFTLVLPKTAAIPDVVTAGLATVGIRVPNHPIALDLIRQACVPIAAPSANRFMRLSPTTFEHVRTAFGDSVPVLEGGPSQVGIESTVVQILDGVVTLLRPGNISRADIEKAIGRVLGEVSLNADGPHASPGMHPRHYSPRTKLLLVEGPAQLPAGLGAYVWWSKAALQPGIHMPANPGAYAARLYSVLHELDQENWPWIAVEAPPDTAEWAAVLDRLKRASTK